MRFNKKKNEKNEFDLIYEEFDKENVNLFNLIIEKLSKSKKNKMVI